MSVKTKDLIIGCTVEDIDSSEHVTVHHIFSKPDGLTVNNGMETFYGHVDTFNGVELTHKVLNDSGFVSMGDMPFERFSHRSVTGIRVWLGGDNTWQVGKLGEGRILSWVVGSIKYLHELQSIFYALTKKELKYERSKE